jgi:hypothetical protein
VVAQSYSLTTDAVRALMGAYWTSNGWLEESERPGPDSLILAIEAGIAVRDPLVRRTHDEWVAVARNAAEQVALSDASEAFLASLSTRRLDLRSALGSLAIAGQLPKHAYAGTRTTRCGVCGLYDSAEADMNMLSFERLKWGGVRRDDVIYAGFDLEQFLRAPREPATGDSVAIGRQVIQALRNAAPDATVTKLASSLRVPKGNKEERRALFEIFGVWGVLKTPGHRSYQHHFVRADDRELPSQHYIDTSYPACWWRGTDGIDEDALKAVLPELA